MTFQHCTRQKGLWQISFYLPEVLQQISSYLPEDLRQITSSKFFRGKVPSIIDIDEPILKITHNSNFGDEGVFAPLPPLIRNLINLKWVPSCFMMHSAKSQKCTHLLDHLLKSETKYFYSMLNIIFTYLIG